MAQVTESRHGMWRGRWLFVLAVAGAAIGLGDIWGFAGIAGAHGGGAFVLVYLVCLALIGVPLMIAEVLIGRSGRLSPINTMRRLTHLSRRSAVWILIGLAGTLAGLLILSYLGVFAGWALRYIWVMASASLAGAQAPAANAMFADFIASPWQVILWQSLFMAMVVYIGGRGVRALETTIRWLMPVVLAAFAVLLIFAAWSGAFSQSVEYLLQPRWGQLHTGGVLAAMGQAIFTLGVGMGAIMAYGAYLPAGVSIGESVVAAVLLDALVTIGAGLVVLPIVVANGFVPSQGQGLLFVVVPQAFAQMPYGALFGGLLFAVVSIAALVSAISLTEPVLAYLVEEYNAKRSRAAVTIGVVCWVLGLGTVFSFNIWSELDVISGRNFFGSVDYVIHNWLLPLVVLGIALFVGFVVPQVSRRAQLRLDGGPKEFTWNLWIRLIVPLCVLAVFINAAFQSVR